MKHKLYTIIRDDHTSNRLSALFNFTIIFLIVLNLVVVVLDTFDLPSWYGSFSSMIEVFSIIVFTFEYLARFWVADLAYKTLSSTQARIKYIFSFMAIVDLLAILPFYIPYILPFDLRILRSVRMIRLMRLIKMNRYTSAMKTIMVVFPIRRINCCHLLRLSFFLC